MQLRNLSWLVAMLAVIIISFNYIDKENELDYFDFSKLAYRGELPQRSVVKDFNAFLLQQLDSTQTVGAAVAVVSYDSVIYQRTFGVKEVGTTDSVDNHTIFRLASVSKGFAGILASILEEDSLLRLDEKIIDIVPGFQLKDSVNTYNLTLKNTLNHTTGLVPHSFDNLVEAGVPMSEIISQFRFVDVTAAPGEVYGYQNAIFSIIDTVLRIKEGKSYNKLLAEKVFAPLKMRDASTDFQHIENNGNVALPHIWTGKDYKALKPNKRYYSASPAAGVNVSITDMVKWLKALLGYNPDVMDSLVLSKITTPTVYTPLKRSYTVYWGDVTNREYSLGWRIYTYHGRKIIYHGGYVKGYKAEIAFCPKEHTGIVFLQNSPNRLASMSVPEFWNRYFTLSDSIQGISSPV